MSIVWDILYIVALAGGAWVVLLMQRLRRKRSRGGWRERCGHVSAREGDRPCLWVHGVSVGEAQSAQLLVERFAAKRPDWDIVISVVTDTGLAAAMRTFPDRRVFRYPVDFSWCVRRSLDRIRPSLVVLMEGDVWPNFVRMATERGAPVVIAGGRVGDHTFPCLTVTRFILGGTFARFAGIGAQTDEYARRYVAFGAPADRVVVTGTLKYDVVPRETPDPAPLARALGIADDELLLVAGSTAPGEESIFLDVYAHLKRRFPKLRLAIVPRRPEHFDQTADIIRAKGFACLRRSASLAGGPRQEDAVILGDTMGELMTFYALAAVTFVGKSLVAPGGGQNMIEPAGLGKPVLFGPHVQNFVDTRDALVSKGAAREVKDAADLESVLAQLLADERLRADLGASAKAVVDSLRGATDRTLDILEDVLASRPKTR